MAEFRCFDAFTLNNFSSSEYIKKRKRTTLFTNAQTIAIGNSNYQKGIAENSIPPGYLKKQTGGIYFKPDTKKLYQRDPEKNILIEYDPYSGKKLRELPLK